MSFTRTFKRKNKDGTVRTYYAEVESVRVGDKVIQRYVRPLGTDPEHPKNILIEPTHFSYLALRLMQDALTPNDLFEMLEKMGHTVKKEGLEKIGINYDFEKKTYSISLFYRKISKSRTQTDARSVKNIQ
jgi:microsomal dipeptidase-like Zn-dependent dipeptidase